MSAAVKRQGPRGGLAERLPRSSFCIGSILQTKGSARALTTNVMRLPPFGVARQLCVLRGDTMIPASVTTPSKRQVRRFIPRTQRACPRSSERRSFMKARCPLISSAPTRLPSPPAAYERPRPSRPSETGPARIITSRLLGIALVVMTSSRCSPSQTPMAFVPKTESGCGTKATIQWSPLPSELRALASELAEELPDWSSTVTRAPRRN